MTVLTETTKKIRYLESAVKELRQKVRDAEVPLFPSPHSVHDASREEHEVEEEDESEGESVRGDAGETARKQSLHLREIVDNLLINLS